MEKEKVMSWVQKLMVKAMHPNTPKHEVEACELKAAEFMARYKITMTQALQSNDSADPLDGIQRDDVTDILGSGGRTDWGYFLGFGIARAFDCKMVSMKYRQAVSFLGYVDDVETCKWFFDYLQIEIYIWAEQFHKNKTERNSYAHGMVQTIIGRLESLYKKVEEIIPSDCTALIVVKKEKVKQFAHQQFPSTKPISANQLKLDSFQVGLKDGKKLDLSNQQRAKVSEQRKVA